MATQSVKDILDTEVPKPSFVLSPSVPAPLPSGVTHTRNGQDNVARTLDPYSGKFEQVGEDTPRVYGSDQSLLVEAAGRTNYVVDSSDLSQWVKGDDVSLGSAVTSIIDGETAYKASQSGFSLFDPAQSKTLSASTETTHALIETDTAGEFAIGVANETTGNRIGRVIYDVSSGTVTTDRNSEGTIQQANARVVTPNTPNGGKLIHLILSFSTPNDGDTARFEYYPDTTNSGDTSIFHHAQLEEARNASSPIVTGSNAKTRAGDDYTIFDYSDDPDQDYPEWWNPDEGTLFALFSWRSYQRDGSTRILSNGASARHFAIGGAKGIFSTDGTNSTGEVGTLTPFGSDKIAVSFNQNDIVLSVNGDSNNADEHNGNLQSINNLEIGELNSLHAKFGKLLYYPRALPESTLNVLTS